MENMVAESVKYMILGMGIVFVFLYIMVLALQWQAKLIAKYFPEKVPEPSAGGTNGVSRKKVAAIIGAIVHHKNRH